MVAMLLCCGGLTYSLSAPPAVPVIGGVVVTGCFLTWLPWEIQGRKWAAAKGE